MRWKPDMPACPPKKNRGGKRRKPNRPISAAVKTVTGNDPWGTDVDMARMYDAKKHPKKEGKNTKKKKKR